MLATINKKACDGHLVHLTTDSCLHFERIDGRIRFCEGLVWVARYPRAGEPDAYATWCDACGEVRHFHDNDPDPCPGCGVDFRGDPIPQSQWHKFGSRHFSDKILIYDPQLDRVVGGRCPACNHEWGTT